MAKTWFDSYGKDSLTFTVRDNPTEYGNYYVYVWNKHRQLDGYLFPDMTIRTLVLYDSAHGYYLTEFEALQAIHKFLNKGETTPMSANSIPSISTILDAAVAEFVNGNQMFTAFDVTTKIRKDNPGLDIYHAVVKNYINDRYENGTLPATYDRKLIPIANPEPWCYFVPTQHNPDQYSGTVYVNNPLPQPQVGVPHPTYKKKINFPPSAANKVVVATFGGMKVGKD